MIFIFIMIAIAGGYFLGRIHALQVYMAKFNESANMILEVVDDDEIRERIIDVWRQYFDE